MQKPLTSLRSQGLKFLKSRSVKRYSQDSAELQCILPGAELIDRPDGMLDHGLARLCDRHFLSLTRL